ncbi:hypothetical protein [Parasphingorhabdus sp.]|uniref:hypothetical protein n=1 Tax=Parasphingorhabdus sp. TaxID=2709688 RepID=UPI003A8EEA2F
MVWILVATEMLTGLPALLFLCSRIPITSARSLGLSTSIAASAIGSSTAWARRDRRWQGNPNYEPWTFGPVLDDIADLGTTLAEVAPLPVSYRQAQTRPGPSLIRSIGMTANLQRSGRLLTR